MSESSFTIQYTTIPSVVYPNATGMRKYLESEHAAWLSFLEYVDGQNIVSLRRAHQGDYSLQQSSNVFETLINLLGNRTAFEQLTMNYDRLAFPPPSSTLIGQLILGLFSNQRNADALAVYAWFLTEDSRLSPSRGSDQEFIKNGHYLFLGALAVDALPSRKVEAKNIAARSTAAQAHVEALSVEVKKAQDINDGHLISLESFRNELTETSESWWARFKRVEGMIFRRERKRIKKTNDLQTTVLTSAKRSIRLVDLKLQRLDTETANIQSARQAQFDALLQKMNDEFKFAAPVQLWEKRSTQHKTASKWALGFFAASGLLTILVAAAIPIYFGDDIAASFHACGAGAPEGCKVDFSAKGPLTVGGLLLIMSVLMWAVRLQYRIFLSERHLSLDASEKEAFAQTYLAIKSESKVDAASEAIVLSALFRPTQDGIIKDDEGGIDFSAASILAKQLGRQS